MPRADETISFLYQERKAHKMQSVIRTIFWEDNTVVMIDQNALPQEERYMRCSHYTEVVAAIKDLTIRGAPAIGVAAAMGIALGMLSVSVSSEEDLKTAFQEICAQFSRTRPTARNLFWAIERMKKRFAKESRVPFRSAKLTCSSTYNPST